MELTYYGLSCFKLKTKSVTVVTDPFNPKDVGVSLSPKEADVVLYTAEPTKDAASKIKITESREAAGKEVLSVTEPGEYEVGGVFVRAHGSPNYHVITAAGISVCYLGLFNGPWKEEDFVDLGNIDYLIVPVGDASLFIDWKQLEKVINEIDPSIVIPSCYKLDGMKGDYAGLKTLKECLSEFGSGDTSPEKKIKLQSYTKGEDDQYKIKVLENK